MVLADDGDEVVGAHAHELVRRERAGCQTCRVCGAGRGRERGLRHEAADRDQQAGAGATGEHGAARQAFADGAHRRQVERLGE